MTQAIFGLLGVLLGGLITFGVELLLQQRREAELVRQAARLVGFELQMASRAIRLALKQDELWLDEDRPGVPSWVESRTVLAAALDPDGWKAVTAAVMLVSLAGRDYERVSPLSERDRKSLGTAAEVAERAHARLGVLTGTAGSGPAR